MRSPDTLLLDLPFDTGAGRTLVDRSDYGHHFSFVNSPVWIGSRRGYGLNFVNASQHHCTLARPGSILRLSELTVLAWARIPSGVAATSLISHANDPSQYAFTMSVAATTSRLRVLVSDTGTATSGTAKLYDSSLTAFDGVFRHVGFSWSGQFNVLDLYVDGQRDPNPTKTWDFTVRRLHPSTARVVVGAFDNPVNFLTGDLAGIKAWAKFLTPTEVLEEFSRTRILTV